MFHLHNICKTYRTEEVETLALSDITLDIEPGEFVAIMGPSGSGKSTLLGILGLLDSPTRGDFHFFSRNISQARDSDLTFLRRKHIGFVFQSFNLISHLNVQRNVELGLIYRDVPHKMIKQRSQAALARVGLEARSRHYPSQLSGGQQQRVAIARAIAGCPDAILADEPTGNLDTENGNNVMDILQSISTAGTTVIMVTHSAEQAKRANRTVMMRDGKILI